MADIATRSVAWVDEFELRKTPQRENKKVCGKEEQEMTPQQGYKKVKDERSGCIWEIFRIGVMDFDFLLAQIFNLISLQERLGGTNPIECDKILALTLRYFATGESF